MKHTGDTLHVCFISRSFPLAIIITYIVRCCATDTGVYTAMKEALSSASFIAVQNSSYFFRTIYYSRKKGVCQGYWAIVGHAILPSTREKRKNDAICSLFGYIEPFFTTSIPSNTARHQQITISQKRPFVNTAKPMAKNPTTQKIPSIWDFFLYSATPLLSVERRKIQEWSRELARWTTGDSGASNPSVCRGPCCYVQFQ